MYLNWGYDDDDNVYDDNNDDSIESPTEAMFPTMLLPILPVEEGR